MTSTAHPGRPRLAVADVSNEPLIEPGAAEANKLLQSWQGRETTTTNGSVRLAESDVPGRGPIVARAVQQRPDVRLASPRDVDDQNTCGANVDDVTTWYRVFFYFYRVSRRHTSFGLVPDDAFERDGRAGFARAQTLGFRHGRRAARADAGVAARQRRRRRRRR